MDRGLAYGEACFETFRVVEGEVFDWPGHAVRLTRGLAGFGLALSDGDVEQLYTACVGKASSYGDDVLIRLTVSGGEAEWGIKSSGEILARIQAMPYRNRSQPVDLQLQGWPFPLKKKVAKFTSDYAETLRALKNNADADVLFEQQGIILAAATANVLLMHEQSWWTPIAGSGVLDGVVRSHLVRHGAVKEGVCPLEVLHGCEAMALCNSGQFILPVASLAGFGTFRTDAELYEPLLACLEKREGVPLEIIE